MSSQELAGEQQRLREHPLEMVPSCLEVVIVALFTPGGWSVTLDESIGHDAIRMMRLRKWRTPPVCLQKTGRRADARLVLALPPEEEPKMPQTVNDLQCARFASHLNDPELP